MHTFREWEISEVEKAYFAQLHTLTNSCCWRRSHHHHPMQPQNYIDIQGVLSNLLVLYMVHKSLVYCVYMRREKGLYCSNRVQWPWSRCRCLMSGFLQINCTEPSVSKSLYETLLPRILFRISLITVIRRENMTTLDQNIRCANSV